MPVPRPGEVVTPFRGRFPEFQNRRGAERNKDLVAQAFYPVFRVSFKAENTGTNACAARAGQDSSLLVDRLSSDFVK